MSGVKNVVERGIIFMIKIEKKIRFKKEKNYTLVLCKK